MNPEWEQLAQQLAGALVNGWYQGLLLATVLWLGVRLLRGTNAAARHAVGFMVLLIVAGLPVLHLLISPDAPRPAAAVLSGTLPVPPVSSERVEFRNVPALRAGDPPPPSPFRWNIAPSSGAAEERSTPYVVPGFESGPSLPSSALPEITAKAETMELGRITTGRVLLNDAGVASDPAPVQPLADHIEFPSVRFWRAEIPEWVSVCLLLLVGLVAGARLLRLGWQWLALLRLKRAATPASRELTERFEALERELSPARPVRLLVSDRITTPMVVGYLQPAVLVPSAIACGTAGWGIEGVLRHELAHVRRRDDWCNLLQQIIAAIYCYHPAVVWLSRRLTIDREIACDDLALARNGSRREYALLLTEFAGRDRNREWIAAPAAWSNRSQLKERINMILDPNRNTSQRQARTGAGALTVAALVTATVALIAGPRLVLAATADPASAPPAAGAEGVPLAQPSSDEGSLRSGRGALPGFTGGAASDVERHVDHLSVHAITGGGGPDVTISTRPTIQVLPAPINAPPGAPGIIVAQAPPTGPARPAATRPPKAPKPSRVPNALTTPAPELPLPPEESQESISQRMERVERMLEQLLHSDRQSRTEFRPGTEMEVEVFDWHHPIPSPGEPFIGSVPNPDQHWPTDEAQRRAMEKSFKAAEKEMARATKEGQREIARVHKEVETARRDAGLRTQLEVKKEFGPAIKEAELHRTALEGQRRSIEREMENLSRHLEALEQQLEKLDEQMERLDERAEDLGASEEPSELSEAQPRVKEKAVKP